MAMFSVPSSTHNCDILSTMSFQDLPHAASFLTGLADEETMGSLMVYPGYDEQGRKQLVQDGRDKENSTGSGQQKRKSISTRGNSRQKSGKETGTVSMSNETKKRGRPRVECPDKTAAEVS